MKIEVIARKRIANKTWKASHICKYIEENLSSLVLLPKDIYRFPGKKEEKNDIKFAILCVVQHADV